MAATAERASTPLAGLGIGVNICAKTAAVLLADARVPSAMRGETQDGR